jgi:hypothetical protein
MPVEQADDLLNKHQMLISADSDLTEPFNRECDKLALVSFGGSVRRIKIAELMRMADEGNVGMMVSKATSNSEAHLLSSSFFTTAQDLKEQDTPHYCYLMMTKLEDTNIYYLVLNPTLVRVVSNIELEGNCWIEHIQGIRDTVKDNLFSMRIEPGPIANHIIVEKGEDIEIEPLCNSVIQPEDKMDVLKTLQLEISTYTREEVTTEIQGESLVIKNCINTPLKLKIHNKLLGDFISDREQLQWEYIVTEL